MKIKIVQADYLDADHAAAIGYLVNAYAMDPMGGGKPLESDVVARLARTMASISHAVSVLAYADEKPAGLINCFEGFSTFRCKTLLNIHDVIVLKEYRGNGLSQLMLHKVEEIAQSRGCCKLTLEVLTNNFAAQAAYKRFGFSGYELTPEHGQALFWQKELVDE